jgi:hypothetical protein
VLAALAVGSCAAARLEAGALVVRDKGYRVRPPAGWTRLPGDADVALRHPGLEAGLLAHGSCGGRAAARPPGVLARHLRVGLRDVRDRAESPAAVAGLSGIRTRFTATLDGRPVAVETLTLRGAECVYDLALVAPPERRAEAAGAFEGFAGSFELLARTP